MGIVDKDGKDVKTPITWESVKEVIKTGAMIIQILLIPLFVFGYKAWGKIDDVNKGLNQVDKNFAVMQKSIEKNASDTKNYAALAVGNQAAINLIMQKVAAEEAEIQFLKERMTVQEQIIDYHRDKSDYDKPRIRRK